jgi:UDP-N-acetylmuramoyl-tripeptide--D-alanyl-D-alanine ligase
VVILNVDDTAVAAMAEATAARVVRVSREPGGADVWVGPVTLDELARPRFTLHSGDGQVEIALAVHGDHQVSNAMCAAAVALECGASLEQVAAALAAAGPVSKHRMAVATRDDGVTVINDAYNANPDSMLPGSRRWPPSPAKLGLGRSPRKLGAHPLARESAAAGPCSARWQNSATTRYPSMTASAGWRCD